MGKWAKMISEFFYNGAVKNVPEGHMHCPACEGTGDYDSFSDCESCKGEGYVSYIEASRVLKNMESEV